MNAYRPSPRDQQIASLRFRHGLHKTRARLLAELAYGEFRA